MSTSTHGGGCLCGGVRYEISGPTRPVVFCHCRLCRIQGSIATVGISRRSLRLVKWQALCSYDSSAHARRWFCGRCGAAIYWDPIGRSFLAIFAGTLDQPTGLRGSAHIYVAERPDYYQITDDLEQYPGPMHPELNDAPDQHVREDELASGTSPSTAGFGAAEANTDDMTDDMVEVRMEECTVDEKAGRRI